MNITRLCHGYGGRKSAFTKVTADKKGGERMADSLVGKITHYYDHIGVAVIEVSSTIKVGDRLKITGHDQEFEQTVSSMQVEHQNITEAKKGEAIGMKVDQPVKEGDQVYKIE